MAECLRRAGAGIPVTVVLDSAVGYIMGKVDFVLVGAEGVVENGGLINQVGAGAWTGMRLTAPLHDTRRITNARSAPTKLPLSPKPHASPSTQRQNPSNSYACTP